LEKYLGVLILVNGRDKRAFDFVIEKIRDKLAGWKARTLSLAGRCTLIQSVTTTIPIHTMQNTMLCKTPCSQGKCAMSWINLIETSFGEILLKKKKKKILSIEIRFQDRKTREGWILKYGFKTERQGRVGY
jgi:hypothetical protein